ncbi:MAG: AraC family transcriptional regulator [Sphingobacteriales bacterium]|nr:AraC family transcriptional regulator [Sphingobacteriales bacterium]
MLLHIKNMVCDRCIMVVRQQLEQSNFIVQDISLGTVEIQPEPIEKQLQDIASNLKVLGFELIDKQKDQLVERIKNVIVELVHHTDLSQNHLNMMEQIANRLNKDYAYLSRLFSDSEDTTIEKFIIQQKIEKVKELLEYGEMNLNEISYQMGYSSSAHLSSQFKAVTGITPSVYKSKKRKDRKALDKV